MTQYQGCKEALDLGTCDRELGHDGLHEMVDPIYLFKDEYALTSWPIQRDTPEVRRYYERAAIDDPEEAAAQAEDAIKQEA